MSYRCSNCNNVHNGSMLVVPSMIRNVKYIRVQMRKDWHTKENFEIYDGEYMGTESVGELKVCQVCHDVLKAKPIPVSPKDKEVKFVFKPKKVEKDSMHKKSNENDRRDKSNNSTRRDYRYDEGYDDNQD